MKAPDWLRQQWTALVIIFAAVGAVWQFHDMAAEAKDAKDQIRQLAEIASDLRDPNLWLRNYLLNHGIDSTTARTWSTMQKGPVPDSLGHPLPGIPFLDMSYMPEIGILTVIEQWEAIPEDGEEDPSDVYVWCHVDTLWTFLGREKAK